MSDNFIKFPQTLHLIAGHNFNFRKDKAFSSFEVKEFLQNEVVLEEKIDGANLGISFDKDGKLLLQNRGNYLNKPFSGQWIELNNWLDKKLDSIFDVIEDKYILFGEWCYAKHSIFYTKLPDFYIAFDIYDKINNEFLSTKRRNTLLISMGISSAPFIDKGVFTINEIINKIQKSNYSSNTSEGIYIRLENEDTLIRRAKLVRPDFTQNIEEHWASKKIIKNIIENN
ncbi:RNA ligase family protein [Prodigiosinella aquatilis]|nr:RNA ligase family protein [Prodigiosinella sp. LS101]WJV54674.1 RNA ligase family protein [Prodigiosinella sp. LS101]WJV59037.1 RNA ligase family protein [Pectobacteriaceae bacterium C111]